MQDDKEAIAFLIFKLKAVEKVTNMQEAQIAELTRERDALLKNVLSVDLEKSKEKLRQGREKERKRRDSLDKVKKEEREKIRQRTEIRQEELSLEQLRKEADEDRQSVTIVMRRETRVTRQTRTQANA